MSNQASWITAAKAKPLKVDNADMWKPGPNEVLIKNAAWAVNPVDWKIQDSGYYIQKYPNILGEDSAGEIYEVGSNVTNLKRGQRVMVWSLGLGSNEPREGAFQLYSIAKVGAVAPIPDSMSFEQAATMPLSISTAAAAFYQKAHFGLPYPSKDPKPSNKTILIWGATSSVGSTAIQLARASGLTVFGTASSRHHALTKELGAEKVFDYSNSGVVDEIAAALKGSDFVGIYDTIASKDTYETCGKLLAKLGGGMVVGTLPPMDATFPDNVKTQGVFAVNISTVEKEVGDEIWNRYVPEALKSGQLQAKLETIVIQGGLAKMQEGLDRQKKGVSAAKVVVKA